MMVIVFILYDIQCNTYRCSDTVDDINLIYQSALTVTVFMHNIG